MKKIKEEYLYKITCIGEKIKTTKCKIDKTTDKIIQYFPNKGSIDMYQTLKKNNLDIVGEVPDIIY